MFSTESMASKYEALRKFYLTERLPQLENTIYQIAKNITPENRLELEQLITEANEAIDFIHQENAAYFPHYRVVNNGTKSSVDQFIPAFETKQIPAKKQITTTKESRKTSKPSINPFSLPFIGKDSSDLTNFDSPFDSQAPTDSTYTSAELEFLDTTAWLNPEEPDLNPELPPGTFYYHTSEEISPGMFLLQLETDEDNVILQLYVPHIPVNIPFVALLIQEHLELGLDAHVTFSFQDYRNNLILPVSPTDHSKRIDPRLN